MEKLLDRGVIQAKPVTVVCVVEDTLGRSILSGTSRSRGVGPSPCSTSLGRHPSFRDVSVGCMPTQASPVL